MLFRLVVSFVLGLLLLPMVLASEYTMPPIGDDIIGQNYTITVQIKDSLTAIREKHDVSYEELIEANPAINFYKLKVGQKVIIPKQFILPKFRRGIVINIPELRLYYFTPDGKNVYTFPIGLGREGWRTPIAAAQVVSKNEDPVWYVPKSIRDYVLNKTGEELPTSVPPGPKNPLGKYALYLSLNGYLIHGTNAHPIRLVLLLALAVCGYFENRLSSYINRCKLALRFTSSTILIKLAGMVMNSISNPINR